MKRVGGLYGQVICWKNLLYAAQRARRGKRFRPNVARFEYDVEFELLRLQHELNEQTYRPGPYRQFVIHEPKRRIISAAPYRDRVVHHALCNVIEPVFDARFIHDSYACRRGKGTHAAVARAGVFARRFQYVLQADVQKYFPSVDHRILIEQVGRKIKDPRIMWLVELIVSHSGQQQGPKRWFAGDDLFTPFQRPCGLPIGNQTSQFLANVMLDPLDHYIKEHLRIAGYVRYADDLLLFGDDKYHLDVVRDKLHQRFAELRLTLHPNKTVIYPVANGIPFLGYRLFSTHRLLSKKHVCRFRRRLRSMQRAYAAGRLKQDEVRRRLVSWQGHASHANSYRLAQRLFLHHPFTRRT